jgi:hypothetical protein
MKSLLTRALGGLAVSPKFQEMEGMAAEYHVSAKEWRAREKVEELAWEFQRKKAAKEYEDWKNSRPEPPPTIQRISSPPTDLSYSSDQTSNRVMDEINQLHLNFFEWEPEATLVERGASLAQTSVDGMESQWVINNTDVTSIIHPPQSSESFLWAQIDQTIVEGIAWIEWPDPDNWKGFSVPFVWRGRDEGTGEIQFQDSVNCGSITFTSAHECLGDFACEFGGPFDFVGRKVERGLPERAKGIQECQKEFQGLNQKR